MVVGAVVDLLVGSEVGVIELGIAKGSRVGREDGISLGNDAGIDWKGEGTVGNSVGSTEGTGEGISVGRSVISTKGAHGVGATEGDSISQ